MRFTCKNDEKKLIYTFVYLIYISSTHYSVYNQSFFGLRAIVFFGNKLWFFLGSWSFCLLLTTTTTQTATNLDYFCCVCSRAKLNSLGANVFLSLSLFSLSHCFKPQLWSKNERFWFDNWIVVESTNPFALCHNFSKKLHNFPSHKINSCKYLSIGMECVACSHKII